MRCRPQCVGTFEASFIYWTPQLITASWKSSRFKGIDHQRVVTSAQVLLHQSKSEPAKPMMMITMRIMIIMKPIFHGNQTQLNIYPVETLRDHHRADAYAAPTLSVRCAPAGQCTGKIIFMIMTRSLNFGQYHDNWCKIMKFMLNMSMTKMNLMEDNRQLSIPGSSKRALVDIGTACAHSIIWLFSTEQIRDSQVQYY